MELKFLICGLEHSGTTLVSDIFRQVEGVDSGFECGVLLCNSPREFPEKQPFFSNMPGGWQIAHADLKAACDTDRFSEFYTYLYEKSEFFNSRVEYIFDKTPRYFQNLFECQAKAEVPVIATYKDPRSIVFSDYKRTGKDKSFKDWYEKYKSPKLRYLSNIYENNYLLWKTGIREASDKILCVSLEDICLNTRHTVSKMFSHAGFEFKIEYLLLKNLRYSHTRLPQVSSRIPFEYLEGLSIQESNMILSDFSCLEDWFYT